MTRAHSASCSRCAERDAASLIPALTVGLLWSSSTRGRFGRGGCLRRTLAAVLPALLRSESSMLEEAAGSERGAYDDALVWWLVEPAGIVWSHKRTSLYRLFALFCMRMQACCFSSIAVFGSTST